MRYLGFFFFSSCTHDICFFFLGVFHRALVTAKTSRIASECEIRCVPEIDLGGPAALAGKLALIEQ